MLPGEELQGADSLLQCSVLPREPVMREDAAFLLPMKKQRGVGGRVTTDRAVVQSSQHLPEDCLSSSSHFVMVLGIEPRASEMLNRH